MSSEFTALQTAMMQRALHLAAQAGNTTSPNPKVGCVIAHGEQIVGEGFHVQAGAPHAEVHAWRQAGDLARCATAYVTLEPCTMCIGALIHARVDRLIYAASEPRAGMVGSQMNLAAESFYNHRIQVHKGLCREHSSQMLKDFFRQRRQASKQNKR